ncbi:dihydroxy-acid dehydratase [Paenibacillus baekrokdamisoli]|uniref:Dihydroxy-acid dehydratase n=1 Tax=Paenibacillus baekrokdamisoli TaxID=1712516 RepID=A0A3G9J355_9BACL|nr:dihydroxy-acid dehydratase [Paenibacillus baekrokdamisoli]MBB3067671.1 dihydroxy-acid dehydratase [Paenibacillus baekrokdamisoli]BBH19143.1 dihydroxy-acid dehydratase [Paenibacillus baekrokdamisoli]
MSLRSDRWFKHPSKETRFQHLSAMRANGHVPESFVGKPIIGIFNSWSDLNSCNAPHKELVEFVKRGVLLAGGYPLEMHTITTPSDFMKPSDLPYRNLMAMDVEESIRALPIDGAVLLCECDKTTPAQLMGAASSNIPSIQLAAGHRASGSFRGKKVNYGTDLWRLMDDYNAGLMTDEEWKELEKCISCTQGGCPVMGTSSTMKCLSEVLGMMLPGTSTIPATHAGRKWAAEETGKRIVEMVREDLTPARLMTEAAFDNAIKLLAAIGGSTNAVIHLTAIAGRLGISIPLKRYEELSVDIPLLVNLQPSGEHSMDDFFEAGGLGAVISRLLPELDTTCLSALGTTLEESYRDYMSFRDDVIYTIDEPFKADAGIAVFTGNLAPSGAILKRAASSLINHKHRGKAIVFDSYEDMHARIDSEELEVDEMSVLVLRNCGPIGAGMPEWGALPIPKKLLKQGVRDMVRISDARMSGTSFGTNILHVSPEAQLGGPLAAIRSGDWIEVDLDQGILHVELDEAEIAERMKEWTPVRVHKRGFMRLHTDHILQAEEGCDLDFLRPRSKEDAHFIEPTVGRG